MNGQEIIVGILALGAIIYLVRFFVRLNKKHKCDDCGLMDMQKEKEKRQNA